MPATKEPLLIKAKLFRGLADGSRLSILEALREGPRNVSEIVEETGLLQSNASLHLNCLWCCGMVDREVKGRRTYYRLGSPKVLRVLQAAERLLEDVYDRIAECGQYKGGDDK